MANVPSNYVRLRGLPFSAKEDDVRNFLEGLEVLSVTFTLTTMGRASGECYVELVDVESVDESRKFDKKEMSGRYIEVFSVSEGEVNWMVRHGVLKGGDNGMSTNYVVRLRGIPFSATPKDVKEFFDGLEVADVVIDKEPGGRPSGEAFVKFTTKQHAELALERNKNHMGARYVEVFRSSTDEMANAAANVNRAYHMREGPPFRGMMGPRGYDRYNGGPMRGPPMRGAYGRPYDIPYDRYRRLGGNSYDDEIDFEASTRVFMRGLPYSANALDIEDFFKPLNCVDIKLGYNEDRRPSGDAIVIFSTMAEARDALSRNKKCIGTRYIELFSGSNMPPTQKHLVFCRVGRFGGMGPRPGPLSGRGGHMMYDDDYGSGYGSGYGGPGGHQFYDDEYEGRPTGYGRHWNRGGVYVKAAW
uniref:RRM domain-containing protein n=1 Tax=Syphacia muris TaxID=451379 RepID=A0A0N5AJ77_9BILA